MSAFSLQGRSAVVTGGSRGIGRAIALRLADAGADVALTYRERADEAGQIVREIAAKGRRSAALQMDVTNRVSVQQAARDAKRALGPISILVNNAGFGTFGAFHTLDLDAEGARFGKPVRAGMVFVDGIDIGDPSDAVMRDRSTLSSDGIMFVVATVSEQEGNSLAPAEVIMRGVPVPGDEEKFVKRARKVVEASLDRAATEELHEVELLEQVLHDDLARFVYDDLRRRPMILPLVIEV